MEEAYFEAEKIAENTWKVISSGDFSYVIAGKKTAVAVDTGYGAGNIREYMQSLTEKPLTSVVNTHDHFDHTANNWYFDMAYMTRETAERASRPLPSFWGIPFQTRYEKTIIEDGDSFELGERMLSVFRVSDHSAGSIVLLDPKERLLFSGDEFMPECKRFEGSIQAFYEKFMRLYEYRGEIDLVCAGCGVFRAVVLDRYRQCMEAFLNGEEGSAWQADDFRVTHISGPNGKPAYDRRSPHPEDLPAPISEEEAIYFRVIRRGEVSIIYDIRKQ